MSCLPCLWFGFNGNFILFCFSYNILNENDIEGEEDGISGMDGEVKVSLTQANYAGMDDFNLNFKNIATPGNTVQYARRIGRRAFRC